MHASIDMNINSFLLCEQLQRSVSGTGRAGPGVAGRSRHSAPARPILRRDVRAPASSDVRHPSSRARPAILACRLALHSARWRRRRPPASDCSATCSARRASLPYRRCNEKASRFRMRPCALRSQPRAKFILKFSPLQRTIRLQIPAMASAVQKQKGKLTCSTNYSQPRRWLPWPSPSLLPTPRE